MKLNKLSIILGCGLVFLSATVSAQKKDTKRNHLVHQWQRLKSQKQRKSQNRMQR